MKVAIVGSRNWDDTGRVIDYINSLPPDTIIVSGGARGVDSIAEQQAKKRGLKTEIYLPDWKQYGKQAGVIRNSQIVDACDRLVAFQLSGSKGTQNSIDKALKENKSVEVIRETI